MINLRYLMSGLKISQLSDACVKLKILTPDSANRDELLELFCRFKIVDESSFFQNERVSEKSIQTTLSRYLKNRRKKKRKKKFE